MSTEAKIDESKLADLKETIRQAVEKAIDDPASCEEPFDVAIADIAARQLYGLVDIEYFRACRIAVLRAELDVYESQMIRRG